MPLLLASEFSNIFDKAISFLPKTDKATVTIINTASIGEGFTLDYETEIKPFEDEGYTVELCDLATCDNVPAQLAKTDICYVAGGNTFYLLEHVKKSNFAEALKTRLDDDFLYIGSSAGSVLMSPDIDFIAQMDDKSRGNLTDTKGMDYIPFSLLPHVGHPTMGEAAIVIKKTYEGDWPLFCLTDDQAIYIDGNKIEILG